MKIKNGSQNILTNLFVSGVFNKNVIFSVLLMIMYVQFTLLMNKSSGLQRKHPPPFRTHLHTFVQGLGK
jgi:hypothetical protein